MITTIYGPNQLEGRDDVDVITPDQAQTLDGLFRQRLARSADKTAYHEFENDQWHEYTWQTMAQRVDRWCAAFQTANLNAGDRVAILQKNSIHWVSFDQAAHACGLVLVPLYMEDRAENMAYIMDQTQSQLLFIDTAEHWETLRHEKSIDLGFLKHIVCLDEFDSCSDARVVSLDQWLPEQAETFDSPVSDPKALASIIFTSGTTGRPKGVMLSHQNMLTNAFSCVRYGPFFHSDKFLSFLPLSHTFERTVGLYMTMMAGSEVAYARSISELGEDLLHHKPSVIVTVPRIFERVYQKIMGQLNEGPALKKALFEKTVDIGWHRFELSQGRASWSPKLLLWPLLDKLVASKVREKLGGRLRCAVSGGAPLPVKVGKTFVALGINIVQGYGLTETAPVLTSNLININNPLSIGLPLLDVKLKLGEGNEILAKGPNIMLGYWENEEATKQSFTEDGWLKTGDCGRIDEAGFLYIIGRIKEILVLSTGEKVPPADMESAIAEDPLFEQSMVIGEAKPYLSALVVLNQEVWVKQAKLLGVDANSESVLASQKVRDYLIKRIANQINDFPGYAQIYKVCAMLKPWSVDDGFLTPTLKLKRPVLKKVFAVQIDKLYEGH